MKNYFRINRRVLLALVIGFIIGWCARSFVSLWQAIERDKKMSEGTQCSPTGSFRMGL